MIPSLTCLFNQLKEFLEMIALTKYSLALLGFVGLCVARTDSGAQRPLKDEGPQDEELERKWGTDVGLRANEYQCTASADRAP